MADESLDRAPEPHDTRDIERIAASVHERKAGKVPVWAWRTAALGAGAMVITALVAADHYRWGHLESKVLGVFATLDGQLKSLDSRVAEGERIREARLRQLEGHETRISVVESRVTASDGATREAINKLEAAVNAQSLKIDKLMERRNP